MIILAVLAAGCASENPNVGVNMAGTDSPAGFFYGLFHGLVAVFSFIGSIFTDIGVYEVNNTGIGYNAGFVLGIGSVGGGAASR